MTTIAEPTTVTVLPVAALYPSSLNPRKHFDEAKLQALAESVVAQGILQNLVVRPAPVVDPATHLEGRFEIAAGERRWRAVMLLVEAGELPEDYPMPVAVRMLSDLEVLEIAMSENVKRADMHPLEEADGYLQMVKLGETAESIATRTGAAESSVQKRLRIAENLCDTGRKRLLEGRFTLAQAQALTVAPKKDQEAYLKGMGAYWNPDPSQIRRSLMQRNPPLDRAFFKPKVYTDKGGTIITDLFGEEGEKGYFADLDLFIECQKEAIEGKRAQLEKKGKPVLVEYEEYSYSKYGYREGHTLICLSPHNFSVTVHEDRGLEPKVEAKAQAKADGTLPPQKNKKRLAFEDQALTRAAQHGVYKSQRLAMVLAIAGAFKTSGLRHRPEYQSIETRRGDYQDFELKTFLQTFREDVYDIAGEKLPKATDDAPDLLSGPYVSGKRARSLLEHLNDLADPVLETLFRAVTAAHIEAILEGEPREAHLWLLEQSAPDMHDFFTADAAYLDACKKDELAVIAPEVGAAVAPGAKKAEVVAGLAAKPMLKTWLPDRLRLGEK